MNNYNSGLFDMLAHLRQIFTDFIQVSEGTKPVRFRGCNYRFLHREAYRNKVLCIRRVEQTVRCMDALFFLLKLTAFMSTFKQYSHLRRIEDRFQSSRKLGYLGMGLFFTRTLETTVVYECSNYPNCRFSRCFIILFLTEMFAWIETLWNLLGEKLWYL